MPLLAKPVAACCSAARVVLSLGMALSGVAILTVPGGPSRAAEPLSFTIPAEDGYGIADCMQAGSECGQAMATSWCEAHGHAHVAAFGMAEDVTGTIAQATPVVAQSGTVVIRCTD
jgi:hypothetical protein